MIFFFVFIFQQPQSFKKIFQKCFFSELLIKIKYSSSFFLNFCISLVLFFQHLFKYLLKKPLICLIRCWKSTACWASWCTCSPSWRWCWWATARWASAGCYPGWSLRQRPYSTCSGSSSTRPWISLCCLSGLMCGNLRKLDKCCEKIFM